MKSDAKQMARRKQLTLPDLVTLSILSEQPMHGYQLVTELEVREVKDWAAISRPQVYYSLNKLLSLKLISEAKDSDYSLGPERTVYKVNSKGKEELAESLSIKNWARQRTHPPFLTWMALSTHLPKATIRKLFELRREYLRAELAREQATLNSFDSSVGGMVTAGRLMVELTIQMFETELSWLNSAQDKMLSR